MSITVQEYAQSDRVDAATSYGMAHAIAEAGKTWGELPAGERNAQKAEEIAIAAVKNEDMFLDKAGTREVVAAYNEALIERSYARDEKDGVEKGTHLQAYLDDVADAVQGVDFEKVKKRDLSGLNGKTLKGIQSDISASAKKNIGMKGTIEQDLLQTIKDDTAKEEDQQKFKDVTVDEPQEMGGGLIQMIMMFIGALLGIDIGAMMGGNNQEAERKLEENHLAFSPEMEEKFNALIPAATRLRDGKGTAADLKTVNDFAGISDADKRDLNDEQKKALGGAILDDVTKLRSGQVTESQMSAHIVESYRGLAASPAQAPETNKAEPTSPDAIAETLAIASMGGKSVAAAASIATFGNIDFDKVAAFAAKNMEKLPDQPPAAPLANDGGLRANVSSVVQRVGKIEGGRE